MTADAYCSWCRGAGFLTDGEGRGTTYTDCSLCGGSGVRGVVIYLHAPIRSSTSDATAEADYAEHGRGGNAQGQTPA